MKCPRTFWHCVGYDDVVTFISEKCLEEECAWWREDHRECALLRLSYQVEALVRAFTKVERKEGG